MNINRIWKLVKENKVNILATILLISAWTAEKFIIDGYNDKMEDVRRQIVEHTQCLNGVRIAEAEFALQQFNISHDSLHMNKGSYALTLANVCAADAQLITAGQLIINIMDEDSLRPIQERGLKRQAQLFKLGRDNQIQELMTEKIKFVKEVEDSNFKSQLAAVQIVNSVGAKRDRAHWYSLIFYIIGISILTLNNSFRKEEEDKQNEEKYNTLVTDIRKIAHQKNHKDL